MNIQEQTFESKHNFSNKLTAFENVICKMLTIVFQPYYVKI